MTASLATTVFDAAALGGADRASQAPHVALAQDPTCSAAWGAPSEDDDERAPTTPYIEPVFFGTPIPKFPADKPLPAHVVVGSTDQTRDERTPRGSR